jgi:uncharacterized membrane protein YeaQ/YmgE (transglycosylase-associated protein family)
VKWQRGRRLVAAPGDSPRRVLLDVAERLLARALDADLAQAPAGRKDAVTERWADIRRNVLSDIDGENRSSVLRREAEDAYAPFVSARAAAIRDLGRLDYLSFALVGAIAGYLAELLARGGGASGLTPEILAILAAALITRVAIRAWRLARQLAAVADAHDEWLRTLEQVALTNFIDGVRKATSEVRLRVTIARNASPHLIYGQDPGLFVKTGAMTAIDTVTRTIGSGSLGISGPRGAGKTTILQKFDTRDDPAQEVRDIRVSVSAPVDYDPREFIIHLFSEVCDEVLELAPQYSAMAVTTRRHLEALRFLRTYSTGWSATLTPTALINLARSVGRAQAEQPAGLPDLVAQFRDYCTAVVAWNREQPGRDGGYLIICIDEMDKIRDSDRAEVFLNDIKATFGVRGCLYLVALSEDAMTVFAQATPAIRTAFDSAFDEIVSVRPMIFREAVAMLDQRVAGIPWPFLALCHVLAGGVPRELLRAARSLIQVARPSAARRTLPAATAELIRARCEVMRQEAVLQLGRSGATGEVMLDLFRPGWPFTTALDLTDPHWPDRAARNLGAAADTMAKAAGDPANGRWKGMYQDVAVALELYATVIQVFACQPDAVASAIKDQQYGLIEELAITRHAMRGNSELARGLLGKYRTDHQLGNVNGTR